MATKSKSAEDKEKLTALQRARLEEKVAGMTTDLSTLVPDKPVKEVKKPIPKKPTPEKPADKSGEQAGAEKEKAKSKQLLQAKDIPVDPDEKRVHCAFHMRPKYESVVTLVGKIKWISQKGEALEYIIAEYVKNLPDKDYKILLENLNK
jgi:hypothetical protein